VVTGAAMGIGRAYALQLAAEGADIVVADLGDGEETANLVRAAGGTATTVTCDVSDPDSVAALAEEVAALGGADILVNNAGIYPMGPFESITFDDWKRVLSVNLDSVFLMSKALVPHMREQKWGRIICIASGMFHAGSPGSLHYVASKGGVIGFVRSLASELGVDGITVNAIAPGLTRSAGTSTGVHDQLGLFDYVTEHQSIKRVGQPEDLAPAVSFLASDDASFITGQTLLVDGGMGRA
jgi:NAD(P)-dependent dehydrogenase (short-subunit alcohol dehydrogenase family)